jgi:hypothetical protein
MIDTKQLEQEIKLSIKSKVDSLLKESEILAVINDTVNSVIAERVAAIVAIHLSNAVAKGKIERELDTKYTSNLFSILEKEIKQRASNEVAKINMPVEVGKQIIEVVNNRIQNAALPEKSIHHRTINWDGYKLTANALSTGIIESFSSTGIQDIAKSTELTIANNMVIVENNLISRSAEIKENLVANNLTVKNIKINNQLILNDSINKQFVSLINDTINKELNNQKIDIVGKAIYANGAEILTENSLGPAIVNSNLRRLGRLVDLNVAGNAYFNDTMVVTDQGKIGINTTEPEGVLTMWDDDSELTIRRYKKKHMYIGTMRDTELSLGINGNIKLSIRKDNTVEMQKIEINGLKISSSDVVPTAPGFPGEIVIMKTQKDNDPWAYRCIGGEKWKALRS